MSPLVLPPPPLPMLMLMLQVDQQSCERRTARKTINFSYLCAALAHSAHSRSHTHPFILFSVPNTYLFRLLALVLVLDWLPPLIGGGGAMGPARPNRRADNNGCSLARAADANFFTANRSGPSRAEPYRVGLNWAESSPK